MDTEALRSFLVFSETGSMTRTAAQLHRTQSAISQQLKKLEEETGQKLFRREGRKQILTTAGLFLAQQSRLILEQHDQTLMTIRSARQTEVLRIGCPDDYVNQILPDWLAQVRMICPGLPVHITCASSARLRRLIDRGLLHHAIVTRIPGTTEGIYLSRQASVWVCGKHTDLAGTGELPLVLYDTDCKYHRQAIDSLTAAGKSFRITTVSTSASALNSILQNDGGLSLMAETSVAEGLTILDDGEWPAVPDVELAIIHSAHHHPDIGRSQLICCCEQLLSGSVRTPAESL